MAEFIVPGAQTVQPGSPFVLLTQIACPNGYVIHRDGSGILTLRAPSRRCQSFCRYLLSYSGNIAVPTGQTPGEIQIGFEVTGEPERGTIAKVTPAAVGEFFNVSAQKYLTVPSGCCYNVSLDNLSTIPVDGDEQISVQVIRVA